MPNYLNLVWLLLILLTVASHADDQNEEKASVVSHSASDSDQSTTSLQESAGLKTQILQAFDQPVEFAAYGAVISLEPLLILRQQFVAAQAQQQSAQARYQEADQNLQRTQNLHQHDIVSTRRLQEQQAQWRNDKANLSNSSTQQQTILASSRLQWGDALTDWFVQNSGKQAEPFIRNRAQILEIILPASFQLKPEIDKIAVNAQGHREQAIVADLISPAPTVDPVSQGVRYFFVVQGNTMPVGTHVSAWIAGGDQKNLGVLLPENALIWHLGHAFVFVKSARNEFDRHALPEIKRVDQGYFVSGDLKPGDEVVTIGAQTLLSRELKSQIPKEDDD